MGGPSSWSYSQSLSMSCCHSVEHTYITVTALNTYYIRIIEEGVLYIYYCIEDNLL